MDASAIFSLECNSECPVQQQQQQQKVGTYRIKF